MRNKLTRARRSRVLLAEDDAELRALLEISLGADGHEVVPLASGIELIYCFVASPFVDVVICDVRMPELTGLEVLERFRSFDANTPFILMTAFGGKILQEQARRLGASVVVEKPFDLDDLRSLVRCLVLRDEVHPANTDSNVIRFASRPRRAFDSFDN